MKNTTNHFLIALCMAFVCTTPVAAQTVLNFPRVISDNGVFTAISVSNPTATEVAVTFTAYSADGTINTTVGKNPVTLTIPAGGSANKQFQEIFDGGGTFNGWVQATSSTTGLPGFFINGNTALTDLDGAVSPAAASEQILPIALEDATVKTEVTVVNANTDSANATLTLYATDGHSLATKDVSIPSHGLIRQTLSTLFGNGDFSSASHVRVRSEKALISSEVVANYSLQGSSVRRETIALAGQASTASQSYVIPQFISGGGWISLIGLANASGIGQDVTLTAYREDGSVWPAPTNPKRISLDPNAGLRSTATDLFGFSPDTLLTGWIEVKSSLGFMYAYSAYGNTTTPSFAAVPATDASSASRFEVFSQISEGAGLFSGLSIVNTGKQLANVELYTMRTDGSTIGKATFSVSPNQRVGKLFREFVPATLGQTAGWAMLRSSQPILGAMLLGSNNGYALANVPQQIPGGDFIPPAQTTAAITGTVSTDTGPLADVQLTLTGPVNATRTSDALGQYVFSQLPKGDYKVVPSKPGATFSPAEKSVTIGITNVDKVDFLAGGITPANSPILGFIAPASAFVGNTTFNLKVIGNNFTPASIVKLNGQALQTTFINSTELQAVVPQTQLSAARASNVTVETPPPGGGTSDLLPFIVIPVPNDPLIEGNVLVGSFPSGVAIDTKRNHALITNQSDDSVSVVDLQSRQIVQTISVQRSPADGIAIDPVRDIALVANVGKNTVSVIDLNSNTVKKNITVGTFPTGVAIDSVLNKAFVANRDSNDISVIDLDQMTQTTKITPANFLSPSNIAINPKTHIGVVTYLGSDQAAFFDAATLEARGTIHTGARPRGIAINPDTNQMVIVNANSNDAWLIDMVTHNEIAKIPVGEGPTDVAIHRLTNSAVVTNSSYTHTNQSATGQGSVTIINLAKPTEITTVKVALTAFGIDIDEANQRAVVANYGSSSITIIHIPNPKPTITDVEPRTFPAGTGTFTIVITGSGFLPTSVVTVNGTPLPTTYVSPTQLKAQITSAQLDVILKRAAQNPTGKSSFGDTADLGLNIGVENQGPGGGTSDPPTNPQNATLQQQNSKPVLSSVVANSFTADRDVTLTITGNNFNNQTVINFGSKSYVPGSVSDTVMSVVIPKGDLSPGDITVSVTNKPDLTSDNSFTIHLDAKPNPLPTVDSVSPAQVVAGSPNTPFTVTGTGFDQSFTTASLAGISGTVTSSTSISFNIPADKLKEGPAISGIVTNARPGGGSVNFGVTINEPVPTVSSISPSNADAGSNALDFVVNGTNFRTGVSTIRVGSTPIATTFISPTQLKGTLSATVLNGSGGIQIDVINGTVSSSSSATFTINSPKPSIDSLEPAHLPAQALLVTTPATVTVKGTGFLRNSKVTVGGTLVDAAFDGGNLVLTIPASMLHTVTTFAVVVTNPLPGGPSNAASLFIDNTTPIIDSITPNTIKADQTNVVLDIVGKNFRNGAQVSIGTTPARVLTTTFVSGTELRAALTPPLPLGRTKVYVTNPAPGNELSLGVEIEVTALPPVITGVTPLNPRAGESIHVNGSNFGPGSTVLLRGLVLLPTPASSASELIVTIPLDTATGAADVVVRNPVTSTSAAQDSAPFNITIGNPIPVITSLSPNPVLPGQTVTIAGQNFMLSSTVALGSTDAKGTYVSPTTMTFVVPASILPNTYPVFVTNQLPGGGASNSSALTVSSPVPNLTSIDVTSGLAGAAVSINVTGTNFLSGAVVMLGSVPLATTFTDATTLKASGTLPATGGIYKVSVVNPGNFSSNSIDFTVNSPLTITSANPTSGVQGASVNLTITGTGFVPGTGLTVSGDGVSVTTLNVASLTTINATLLIATNATTGNRAVTLSSTTGSAAFDFTVLPLVPVLSSVTPGNGMQGTSVNVTLGGSNFLSGAIVGITGTGVTVTNVNVVGTGSITATLVIATNATVGRHDISVQTSGGTTPGIEFDVLSGGPTLTSITPNSGLTGNSYGVSLNGTNFNTTSTSVSVSGTGVYVGLPSSIVSWWRAENNTDDAVGANFGSSDSTLTYNAGKVGSAFVFDGVSQNVRIPYSPSLIAPQYSVDMWVKPTAAVNNISNQSVLFGQSVGQLQFVVKPGTTNATVKPIWLFMASDLTFPQVASSVEIPVGSYSHLAGTWDGTTLKIYVNGQLSGQLAPGKTPVASQCDFSLGGFPACGEYSAQQFFAGQIDELSFYRSALSASDVLGLYNTGANGKCTNTCAIQASTTGTLSTTFTIAATAAAGARNVSVTAGGGTSNNVVFTVNAAPPTLTSITPTSGVQDSTVNVELAGTNFINGLTIDAGTGINVSNIVVHSLGKATATFSIAPNATSGAHNVTVSTAGGTSAPVTFTVVLRPFVTSVSPLGGLKNSSSTTVTFGGTGLDGVTNVQFRVNGVNDPEIGVSFGAPGKDTAGIGFGLVSVSDGTSLSVNVSISNNAFTGSHSIVLTKGGRDFTVGPNFIVYGATSPALFGVASNQGVLGQTTTGLSITGANLGGITNLSFTNGSGLSVQNFSASASGITADVAVANSAQIGPHNILLNTSNSGTTTNAFLNVRTADGVSVDVMTPTFIHRGDTAIPFSVSGANLGSVTGVEFFNPDRTPDTSISVAGFAASATGLSGSLSVNGAVPVGPRFLILDFAGGVQVPSTLAVVVTTMDGIFAANLSPSSLTAGLTSSISFVGSNPTGLNGFKFQLNNSDDTSMHITNFATTGNQVNASLSIDNTAAAGLRKLVLLPTSGGTVETNLMFNVFQASPTISLVNPLGVNQGKGNVPLTITGTNLQGTTNIQFQQGGSTDAGLVVSGITVTPDGTQITATVNVGNGALLNSHSIRLTRNGSDFTNFGSNGLFVYSSTSGAVYTMTPSLGNRGATVHMSITGANLDSIIGLGFAPQGTSTADPGFTIQNFSATANSITADVTITGSALVGVHNLLLLKSSNSSTFTNATFMVSTSGGSNVTNANATFIHRGDSSTAFTLSGTNLSGVTDIEFYNPDGTKETGISIVSGFSASASSVVANLSAAPAMPVGPRAVVLDFGATQVFTVLNITVETQSPDNIYVQSLSPVSPIAGLTPTSGFTNASVNGGGLTGISGIQFLTAGNNDPTIHVSQFTSSSSSATYGLAIDNTATPGLRNLALLSGGNTVLTNLYMNVQQGNPTITSINPIGASQAQVNVPFTLVGTNLTGTTNVQFLTSGNIDSAITLSGISVSGDGTTLTGTLNIGSGASLFVHSLKITRNGTDFTPPFAGGLFIYSPANPALYTMSPLFGNQGDVVHVSITGNNLSNITSLSFSAQGVTNTTDTGLTVSNFVAGAGGITADVTVTGNSFVGPHNVNLITSGTFTSTNAVFVVKTSNGATITGFSPFAIRRGDVGTSVTVSGDSLIGVTGLEFFNPDGTKENGITVVSGMNTTATNVNANVNVGSGVSVGPRIVVLDFGATKIFTTLTIVVETAQPDNIWVSTLSPSQLTGGSTSTASLFGNGLTGIAGVKFQLNGADDPSIQVSNFSANSTSASFVIKADIGATPGFRTLVLLPTSGGTLPTNLRFNVLLGSPIVSDMSPVGATRGQTTNLTINGVNFTGITALKFNSSNVQDPEITVSNLNVSADGTQITGMLNVTNNAALAFHSITVTRNGSDIFLSNASLQVYTSGSPAVYTVTPTQGNKTTGVNLAITGASLGNVTGVMFQPQGSSGFDSGIVVQNFVASANSVNATLNLTSNALVGPHTLVLSTSTGTVFTNVTFRVLNTDGGSVTSGSPFLIHRGDTSTLVSLFGTQLSGATGVEFFNPDGTTETGIVASGFAANETSVSANLAVDPALAVGPRMVVLDFGAAKVPTTVNLVVETQTAQNEVYVNSLNPSSINAGVVNTTLSVSGHTVGISQFSLQQNGSGDPAIHLSNFQTFSDHISATLSIDSTAAAGNRNVVLIPTGGGTLPTTVLLNVTQANPAVTTISPLGVTQGQGNVALKLTGTDMQGTTAVQFFSNNANDAGITVSNISVSPDGTTLTATANIGNAALFSHSIKLTRNGTDFTNVGSNTLYVYQSGNAALYTMTPQQGNKGTTVNLAITGANLGSVTGLSFPAQNGTGGIDTGITVQNFVSSASGITADLVLTSNALIGPHSVSLSSSNGSFSTNATFMVKTGSGAFVLSSNPFAVHRGDTATAFSLNGSLLNGVTGIEFYNPDGKETGITVASGFTTSATTINANLAVDPTIPVGPRIVVLDFGATQVFTTLSLVVETASPDNIYVSSLGPNTGTAGQSFTVFMSGNLSGISGVNFKSNGNLDSLMQVSNFTVNNNQANFTLSIDSTDTAGNRRLHLLPNGGGPSLPTTLFFNVLQGSPTVSSMTPIGATQNQGNINLTISGANFQGTSAIKFTTNGSNDAGITVSNVTVSADGTQITAVANISNAAIVAGHGITITRNGADFSLFANFTVYAPNSVALYTFTPPEGNRNTTVGITITGAGLGSVTGLSFQPQALGSNGGLDTDITVQNLIVSANTITADVVVTGSALVGIHNVGLVTSTNTIFTNATFNVTAGGGLSVSSLNPTFIHRGDNSTNIVINGSHLGNVTGLEFFNPGGTKETGITVVSGFTTSGGSVSANLQVDGAIAVGPRRVFLDVAGGGPVATTLHLIVESQSGQGNVYVSSINPSSMAAGTNSGTISITGNSPLGISSFKFQLNGSDDTSIHLSNFQPNNSQLSATISIDNTAPTGFRDLILNLSGGGTLAATARFNVTQGNPLLSSYSPIGGSRGQSNVALTLTGVNLTGTTNIQLFANQSNDPNIGVSNIQVTGDTQVTATLNIGASATLGQHFIQLFRGTQTFGTGFNFNVYDTNAPALYTFSPPQGDQGATVNNFTINGANLSGISSLSFGGGTPGHGITAQSFNAIAGQITANLAIDGSAPVGPYGITLNTTSSGSTFTNASFLVRSSAGVSVSILNPSFPHRGDTLNSFVITGTNLGSVTGIEFINPDGSTESAIQVSNLLASANSIVATVTLGSSMPIGSRTLVLDFAGNVKLQTTLILNVQSTSGEGNISASNINPSSAFSGQSLGVTINGSGLGAVSGFKFQLNGNDDNTLAVTGVTPNQNQLSGNVAVDSGASSGQRKLVLVTASGTLPTNLQFNVMQGIAFGAMIPAQRVVNTGPFTMDITGSGFTPGSRVVFNTSVYNATFIDAQHLTVDIPGTEITNVGSLNVKVQVPNNASPPQYTDSNVLTFAVLQAALSMTPNPVTLNTGGSASVTLSVNQAVSNSGGIDVNLSSDHTNIATVPLTAHINQGDTATTFTVNGAGTGSAVLGASLGGYLSASVTANVTNAPTPIVNVTPATTTLSASGTAVITITRVNSDNGTGLNVNLAASRAGYFNFPNPITIPSGQDHISVTISGIKADPTPPITLSASAAGHTSGSTSLVTVRLLHIQMTPALLLNPTTSANLQIVLSDPAPAGGVTINLASSNTSIATVAASVTIPEGATQTSATVTAASTPGNATITATAPGFPAVQAAIQVQAVRLDFTPTSAQFFAGSTYAKNVTLVMNVNAVQGGQLINLSSSNTEIATVPATVTIPSGNSAVNLVITGQGPGTATITASSAGLTSGTFSASIVAPTFAIDDAEGATSTKTGIRRTHYVRISNPAPIGGVPVTITTTDAAKLKLAPCQISDPQGTNCDDSDNPVTSLTLTVPSGQTYIRFDAVGLDTALDEPRLNQPIGVARDAAGNTYIAEYNGNVIRKINVSGIVSTFAGNGSSAHTGDSGKATDASVNGPTSLAIFNNALYIAEYNSSTIRKIDLSTNIITTVVPAGTISNPYGLAFNAAGDMFISCSGNNKIFKYSSGGVLTTIAGGGVASALSTNVQASTLSISNPTSVDVDAAGNVYYTDYGSQVVNQIDASGVVRRVAGNGSASSFGDNADAQNAQLRNPRGVAVDRLHNILYIADAHRILKVVLNATQPATTPQSLTRYAGDPDATEGCCGDGLNGRFAAVNLPDKISVDANGNLLIADRFNNRVREIAFNTGIIDTLMGSGTGGSTGDGQPSRGIDVVLSAPGFVTRKVPVDIDQATWQIINLGTSQTFGVSFGFDVRETGNERFAETTPVNLTALSPFTVTTPLQIGINGRSAHGTATPTGTGSGRIRVEANTTRFLTTTSDVITILPVAQSSLRINDDPGARIDAATGVRRREFVRLPVAVSSGGPGVTVNLSVVPPGAIKIGRCNATTSNDSNCQGGTLGDTYSVTVLPNSNFAYFDVAGQASIFSDTRLNEPWGVHVDKDGNIYVADRSNYRVRKLSTGGVLTTFAGTGSSAQTSIGSGQQANATTGILSRGISSDAAGNIYIADEDSYAILKVDPSGVISVVAGVLNSPGSANGALGTGRISTVLDVAAATDGTLYIADYGNGWIRKVTPTGVMSTIAGIGSSAPSGSTPAQLFGFNSVEGVAWDPVTDDIYVADTAVHKVYRIVQTTGAIEVVAGTGGNGFNGDQADATQATLYNPVHLAIRGGYLYIADMSNHRIRRVQLRDDKGATVSPRPINTVAGTTSSGYSGEGDQAVVSQLNNPTGVSTDANGDLYIADRSNQLIRKLTVATGLMSAVIGSGTGGYGGDNGGGRGVVIHAEVAVGGPSYLPAEASLNVGQSTWTIDSYGVSQSTTAANFSYRVHQSSSDRMAGDTTFTPTTAGPFTLSALTIADNGTGVTGLAVPTGASGSGRITIPSFGTSILGTSSDVITLLPPALSSLHINDDPGARIDAATGVRRRQFVRLPVTVPSGGPGVAVNLSVVPPGSVKIGRCNATTSNDGSCQGGTLGDTYSVTVLPNSNVAFFDVAGQATAFSDTRLNEPWGVHVDKDGNVYVADRSNYRVRKLSAGGVLTTFAGTGSSAQTSIGSGQQANATTGILSRGITSDAAGNIYIADEDSYAILKVDPSGVISVAAGVLNGPGSTNGALGTGRISTTLDVAAATDGTLYIADYGNGWIRKVSPTGVMSTIAGIGPSAPSGSTPAQLFSFNSVEGVAWDPVTDDIYVADTAVHKVYRIVQTTGAIEVVAGTGGTGFNGDQTDATQATLYNPFQHIGILSLEFHVDKLSRPLL